MKKHSDRDLLASGHIIETVLHDGMGARAATVWLRPDRGVPPWRAHIVRAERGGGRLKHGKRLRSISYWINEDGDRFARSGEVTKLKNRDPELFGLLVDFWGLDDGLV